MKELFKIPTLFQKEHFTYYNQLRNDKTLHNKKPVWQSPKQKLYFKQENMPTACIYYNAQACS